jgi:hypothetical protein
MSWAVLHLAGSPWLSSSWDKKDVHMFLETQGAGRGVLNKNLSLSCLFDPNSTAATQSSPPKTIANRFQSAQNRNHAIFSLSVLLIELCLPCSFEKLRQDHRPGAPLATAIDDYQIALSKVDKIYLEAGDSYGYAVQRCLRLEFPGREVEKFQFSPI